MSKRTHTACYVHLIRGAKKHIPLLDSETSRIKVNNFIRDYAGEKSIPIKALYINPEHVHLLIVLPTNQTIENIVKLIKGSSSHWINHNDIVRSKFSWAVGYAAFTVSKSNLGKVKRYIKNQKEHHRKITFSDEYEKFMQEYANR